MAYVVNEPCIGAKDDSCVEVCPVDASGHHAAPRRSSLSAGRRAGALGAGFLVAAGATALIRAAVPFEHGWWLVAYLALVGGISQVLLGTGAALIRSYTSSAAYGPTWLRSELALWNAGTVAVPLGVFIGRDTPILAGSALLLGALALFAAGLRLSLREASRSGVGWERAYLVVVAFLAGSVLVGASLAEALPWQ
jgi:hypothetical protein